MKNTWGEAFGMVERWLQYVVCFWQSADWQQSQDDGYHEIWQRQSQSKQR